MNLDNLRSFVSIAEHKSFSKAAKALHITQPTLSSRIAVLEGDLKLRLFKRGWHGVELTNYGHMFLPHVVQILTKFDSLLELSDTFREVEDRFFIRPIEVKDQTFTIGINTHLTERLIQPITDFLHKEFPNLTFEFITQTSEILNKLIHLHAIDYMIYYDLHSTEKAEYIIQKTLINDSLVTIVSEEDYFALKDKTTLKNYTKNIYISNNPVIQAYNEEFNQFTKKHFNEEFNILVIEDIYLIRELIIANKGLTILPRSVYYNKYEKHGLHSLHTLSPLPSVSIFEGRHQESLFQQEIEALNTFATELFKA